MDEGNYFVHGKFGVLSFVLTDKLELISLLIVKNHDKKISKDIDEEKFKKIHLFYFMVFTIDKDE